MNITEKLSSLIRMAIALAALSGAACGGMEEDQGLEESASAAEASMDGRGGPCTGCENGDPGWGERETPYWDNWWYGWCTDCHAGAVSRSYEGTVRIDTKLAFWSFHERTKRDPTIIRTASAYRSLLPLGDLSPLLREWIVTR